MSSCLLIAQTHHVDSFFVFKLRSPKPELVVDIVVASEPSPSPPLLRTRLPVRRR